MNTHDNHTDTLLHGALSTGLPAPKRGGSFLLVFLADIEPHHKERLMRSIQPSIRKQRLLTWYPSQEVLRSVAPQRGYSESLANLYGLALVAYRNGHSGFVFADQLTKRRLEGQFPLRGEEERPTVGIIAIRKGEQNDQPRVVVKRTGATNSVLDTLDSFEVNQDLTDLERRLNPAMIYSELGFELHDPDQPAFTPTTLKSFGHEGLFAAAISSLSRETPLPLELIFDIMSKTEKSLMEPIELPPDLEFRAAKPTINIILGFEHTEEEREKISAILQNAINLEIGSKSTHRTKGNRNKKDDRSPANSRGTIGRNDADTGFDLTPKPSVTLIPWSKSYPPSRRDIAELSDAVSAYAERQYNLKMPYLLTKPIDEENPRSTEFISINRTRLGPCVRRTTFNELVRNYERRIEDPIRTKDHENGPFEMIPPTVFHSGYDEPFYPVSHPWNPVDSRKNSIPLFFLTNKLNDAQIMALYEEIQTMNNIDDEKWGKKVICPVPWKEDEPDAEDGTPEDMWRLYTEVRGRCETPLVFADLQSGEDLKVIMTSQDYVPDPGDNNKKAREILKGIDDPRYRGIIYGRVPGRDAHIQWVNLNIVNVNIEELLDDNYETYLRPDWPFHNMLDQYNDWIPEEADNDEL
ncbi:hypothetical protein PENSTE_c003G07734 [Penicillium steckii]|uniref:Uncharacterized protein n=1 Tax=Penicillium steckii TaxID=303698 RepID=A0A1V6TQX7_9EURO|nr:hypothetical protein PENSTE_c003G07734 [Penicillium steckii]